MSQTPLFGFFRAFVEQGTLSSERSPPLPASFLTGEVSLFTPMHMKRQSYFSDALSQRETKINFHQGKPDAVTLNQSDLLHFKMSWI